MQEFISMKTNDLKEVIKGIEALVEAINNLDTSAVRLACQDLFLVDGKLRGYLAEAAKEDYAEQRHAAILEARKAREERYAKMQTERQAVKPAVPTMPVYTEEELQAEEEKLQAWSNLERLYEETEADEDYSDYDDYYDDDDRI